MRSIQMITVDTCWLDDTLSNNEIYQVPTRDIVGKQSGDECKHINIVQQNN